MNYKYDDAVLKKLQKTELEMLKTFDSICEKYGITYFVAFGTAIGALRHQGFIPWDDDIDIGMMREEYKKLLNVPQQEWDNLFLVDPKDNYGLHRTIYPRVYKKNTIFETQYHFDYSLLRDKDDGTRLPIWLDIFVYDRVPSEKWVKKRLWTTYILKKLYYWSKCKIRIRLKDSFSKKVICLVKRSIFYFLNLSKNPEIKIYRAFIKAASNANGNLVTSFELDYNYEVLRSVFEYNNMFPVRRIKFEDMLVPILQNCEEMLKSLYGDYMTLPPIEKRINHPPAILDFGDGKIIVEKRR